MKIKKDAKRPLVMLSIVLAVTTVILGIYFAQHATTPNSLQRLGVLMPTGSLGSQVSLGDARSLAAFKFNVPNYLPEGSTLSKVFISRGDDQVGLFYNNPNLPDSQAFGGSLPFQAQIVVLAKISQTDPVSGVLGGAVPPIIVQVQDSSGKTVTTQYIPQQAVGSAMSVCGVTGFARETSGTEAGVIAWWKGGVLYLITGSFSLDIMLKIANSTC